jgi:sugar phosphate isomerase/epimerase
MGFRALELGLADTPSKIDGADEALAETGVEFVAMVVGCLDGAERELPVARLASLDEAVRERAMNSMRRHARLARMRRCPALVLRGSAIEDAALRAEARVLEARGLKDGASSELREDVRDFVRRVQTTGQQQLVHLCRALHELMTEFPDLVFAIEPGRYIDDLLGFDAMGWVLDDLARFELKYWHDVGRIHMRERQGLPSQERWLDAYGRRMHGIHLQDAAEEEAAMPLGLGEVDFRLVADFTPKSALRVVEIHPRHGRAEILSSVQFLLAAGF